MRHPTTRGLYAYWNAVRRTRLAPRRYEIEPSQIAPYLSDTIILEQPVQAACRIRLAGTQVCDHLGHDLRGALFYELWSESDQRILQDAMRSTISCGGVGLFTFNGTCRDTAPQAEFEILLLPLTHLGSDVERVLGNISVLKRPDWLETATAHQLRLTSNETIWPDGRPNFVVPQATSLNNDLSPIRGHDEDVRRARLVRRERRSFLVYQGGLSQTD